MPILKILNESYSNEGALENLINYVCRSGHAGGVGVDPEYALMQMHLIKQLWHKTDGRQARHFILSFADHEDLIYDEAMTLAYKVAAYYGNQFQVVFGIHYDTYHPHIHFAANSVSFVDGYRYSGGFTDFVAFQNYVQQLVPKWKVELIVEHSNEKEKC